MFAGMSFFVVVVGDDRQMVRLVVINRRYDLTFRIVDDDEHFHIESLTKKNHVSVGVFRFHYYGWWCNNW
jgi:hypothetical protein